MRSNAGRAAPEGGTYPRPLARHRALAHHGPVQRPQHDGFLLVGREHEDVLVVAEQIALRRHVAADPKQLAGQRVDRDHRAEAGVAHAGAAEHARRVRAPGPLLARRGRQGKRAAAGPAVRRHRHLEHVLRQSSAGDLPPAANGLPDIPGPGLGWAANGADSPPAADVSRAATFAPSESSSKWPRAQACPPPGPALGSCPCTCSPKETRHRTFPSPS